MGEAIDTQAGGVTALVIGNAEQGLYAIPLEELERYRLPDDQVQAVAEEVSRANENAEVGGFDLNLAPLKGMVPGPSPVPLPDFGTVMTIPKLPPMTVPILSGKHPK